MVSEITIFAEDLGKVLGLVQEEIAGINQFEEYDLNVHCGQAYASITFEGTSKMSAIFDKIVEPFDAM